MKLKKMIMKFCCIEEKEYEKPKCNWQLITN